MSLIRLHIKQISKYVACFTCTIRGYCAAISLLGSVLKQSCGCTLCVWFTQRSFGQYTNWTQINPLNAELNPIRHLLALVGARHIVHVSRIRVNGTVGFLRLLTAVLVSSLPLAYNGGPKAPVTLSSLSAFLWTEWLREWRRTEKNVLEGEAEDFEGTIGGTYIRGLSAVCLVFSVFLKKYVK